MARRLHRNDYTVGWICALPVELAAAEEMLDEEHADLERDLDDNDENLYALGSIGGHNVAIVCLPAGRIGKSPAATVATQMKATFKGLRFSLMVGIGGGVPSTKADIRLGDVVVSQPEKNSGGVVQYDFGKATPSGFERTGSLNSPPPMLLAAVSKVRSNELREKSRITEHIAKLHRIAKFRRSEAGPDILFEAAYDHEGGETCDPCNKDMLETRQPRNSNEVMTHYGTIASGDQVIKTAAGRDKLSTELGGILCFEMEAAGLMNSFPCLVVRGICDYADSHKNKRWQSYAAGAAAAYAKELLSVIPPVEVTRTPTAVEAMQAPRRTIYSIPFPKNKYFVGREAELSELKQTLLVYRTCRKMSIVGLGGTGKTQVALQFAYIVKDTSPECSIFWIPAVSMESFEQACAEVAKALGIPQTTGKEDDVKELVKRHLSAVDTGQRWLLVVDNADDPDVVLGTAQSKGIVDYLPESEEVMIVYTTRTEEIAEQLTRADTLQLGLMNRKDATDFLEKSLRKDLRQDHEVTSQLLDELTCLPLAIRQATAYLNMNKTSITRYLRLLRNTEQDLVALMSKEFRDDTRYKDSANAVATTWLVSFNQIRERNPTAAGLLEFISCIEWKAIPRSLLPSVQSDESQSDEWQSDESQMDEWQSDESQMDEPQSDESQSDESQSDESQMDEPQSDESQLEESQSDEQMETAIGTLCRYSFLARREGDSEGGDDGEEEWYDMHRLVHLATGIWTSKRKGVAETRVRALQHVIEVFPSDDFENRAVWRAYLPHALCILASVQDSHGDMKSDLSLLVGLCLQEDGRTREAVMWLEKCHRWRSDKLEDRDPRRLRSEHELASAYEADGQIKKAVALLEHVVAIEEKVLAEEHPSRLASQHALASAYEADGQIKKAVELLEHVVAVQKKVLVEEHPSRLVSQHVLAGAYQADGQIKKAVELLEHVVAVREVLAEEHPHRLASQHALASAYEADGQIKKAVELLEHVVAVREKVLVEEHPSRLTSQHELASAYKADGQIKKAVELLELVVAVKEKVLAEEHPARLASQHMLAIAYKADGQIKKAVELLEHVVTIEARVLRDDHPSRVISEEALQIMYKELTVNADTV